MIFRMLQVSALLLFTLSPNLPDAHSSSEIASSICAGTASDSIGLAKSQHVRAFRTRKDLEGVNLPELISGQNIENAFFAAWERMYREATQTTNKSAAIERFLGFVEGRLGVCVPTCWERELRIAKFDSERLVDFSIRDLPFVKASRDLIVNTSPPHRMVSIDGSWHLTGAQIDIPLFGFDGKHSMQLGNSSADCLYLAVAPVKDQNAILGFCLNSPDPFPLARINGMGIVVWESTVRCRLPKNRALSDGFIRLSAEIVTSDSKAVVFGITRDIGYIEAFDLEDGSNLLRFSTADWADR